MAYGTEITSTSGRVQFTTEEPYSVTSAGTAITQTGYNSTIPSTASGEFLVCRPPNNTSGVVAWNPDTGNFLGDSTYVQTFGASNGIKYRKGSTVNALATPGTGYGFDVFSSTGSCIFTSNVGRTLELVLYTELSPTNDWVTYDNPSGSDFNELYVTALDLSCSYNPGIPDILTGWIIGAWAYFDNTNQRIEIRNAWLVIPDSALSTQIYWDSIPYVDTNIRGGAVGQTVGVCVFRCRGV